MQKPQAPNASAAAVKKPAGGSSRPAMPQPGVALGSPYPVKRLHIQNVGSLLALSITLFWFAFIAWNVIKAGGFAAWLAGTTAAAAVTVSSLMLAPAALFWMIVAYLQRAADVRDATEPLRQMLMAAAGVNADMRFSRLHGALREQIALVKSAGEEGTKTARMTLASLAEQNESLSTVAETATGRLAQAGDTLRAHIGSFENLLRAADQGLSGLDRNVAGLAQTLGLRIEAMETLLDRLAERIERQSQTLIEGASQRLDRAAELQEDMERRGQAFSDTLRSLGEDLLVRTREIDQLMARFGDSAESARRDSEKTTSLFQAQVRALDQTTSALRERVGDASAQLGEGVAMLDERARALSAITENCRSTLQSEGQAMAEVSEQVGDRYRLTAERLSRLLSDWSAEQRQMSERLDAIDGRMGERTEALARQANALTTQAQTLLEEAQSTEGRIAAAAAESADRYMTVARVSEMQAEKMLGAVGALLDRQESVIARLDVQSGGLRELAAQAGDTLGQVADTLDSRTRSLAAIEKTFVADAETLKTTTADLVGNLESLTDRLERARLGAGEIADTTVGKLADAAGEALRQTGALNAASETLMRSLSGASETLVHRTILLGETGRQTQNALADAESALGAKAVQVRQDIEGAAESALGQIDLTIRRLRLLPPVLVEEADRAGATLTTIADRIATHTHNFTASLGSDLARLEEAAATERAFLDAAGKDLAASAEKLLGTGAQATEAVRALAAESETAASGLAAATATLANAAELIETGESRIARQLAATAGAGDQLARQVNEWRAKLAEDSEKMLGAVEVSTGRLAALRQSFASAVESIFADVGGNRDALATALKSAGGELEDGSRHLKEILQSASTYLAGFGSRLAQQIGTVGQADRELRSLCDKMAGGQEVLDRTVAALAGDAQMLETRLSDLGAALAVQGDLARKHGQDSCAELANVAQALRQSGAETQNLATMALESAAVVAARYDALAKDAVVAVEAGVQDLVATSTIGRNALAEWSEAARVQTELMRGQTGEIERAASLVRTSALGAGESLTQLSERLVSSDTIVRETSESAARSIASVTAVAERSVGILGDGAEVARQKLSDASHHLRETVGELASGAESAALTLTGRTAELSERSGALAGDLGRAIERAAETGAAFDALSKQALERADTVSVRYEDIARVGIAAIEDGARHLTEASAESVEALSKMGEAARVQTELMRGQTGEIERAASLVRTSALGAGESLTQLSERLVSSDTIVRETSESAARSIASVTAVAERSVGILGDGAEVARQKLSDASHHLRETVGELASGAESAALTLTGRTAELSERSGALAGDLGRAIERAAETGAAFDALSKQALERADTVSVRYEDIARVGIAAIEDGARHLTEASAESVEALSKMGEAEDSRARALALRQADIERFAQTLQVAAQGLEQSLALLSERLTKSGETADTAADRTIDRLAAAVATIERDVLTLGETAEQTGQKLHKATTTLRDDVATLAANSDYGVGQILALVEKCSDQAADVRATLLEQTGEIHEGLGKMLLGLETTSESIHEKSQAARALLDGVSARYAEVAASAGALLEDGGSRLGAGASGLRDALEALRQLIGENMAAFTAAEGSLGEAASRIGRQAETVQQQMRAAIERLEAGETRTAITVEGIAGRMTEMTGLLDRQIGGLTHGAETALTTLESAARGFALEADEVRKQAHGIEVQVRSVTTLSQQMREQGGAVLRSMNEEATRLSENLLRTIAEAEQVDARLQQMATSSGGAVEDSARQLRQASAVLAERLASDKMALGEFTNHFESSLAVLTDAISAQLDRMAESAKDAAARAMDADRRIAQTRDETLTSLSAIGEKLKVAGTEAEEAALRAGMAGEMAEERLASLKDKAEQAASALDRAGESVVLQVRALAEETEQAEHRSKALVGVGADLYEKTHAIRESMQAEHESMLASLTRALLQLEAAETNVERHKDSALARLEDAMRQVARAGDTAATLMENQIGNLRLTASEAVQQFEIAGAGLDEQRQRITGAAGQFTSEMERIVDAGNQAEGDARTVLARIESLREAIVTGIDSIRERVRESSVQMERELANLAEGAAQTVSSVHAAAGEVTRETGLLASGTDQALSQVMAATRTFGSGVATLENDLTAAGMKVMNLVEDLRAEANAAGARMQSLLETLDRQSDEVAERVTVNTSQIARRAEETGSLLSGLGAQLVSQIDGLDRALETVSGSARSALKAVETINGAFGEKADQLEDRVSRLQSNLARQSATLADALSDIIRQVESAGEDITEETKKAV